MERKSLYSLMNEQIIKLDTKSGYETIDEFITDDGKVCNLLNHYQMCLKWIMGVFMKSLRSEQDIV